MVAILHSGMPYGPNYDQKTILTLWAGGLSGPWTLETFPVNLLQPHQDVDRPRVTWHLLINILIAHFPLEL